MHIHRQVMQRQAELLRYFQESVQYGMVFQACADQRFYPEVANRGSYGQVVRLSSPGGKDDLRGLCADTACYGPARLFDLGFRTSSELMGGGRIAEIPQHGFVYGVGYGRPYGSGSGVVEVNFHNGRINYAQKYTFSPKAGHPQTA